MSKRSQEKRRARSKEKQKARRHQQAQGLLGNLGPLQACVCYQGRTPDVDCREINLTVFRPMRGGGTAVAGFLIDYDCLGLKDAFVYADADPVEYRRRAESQSDLLIERISLEKAQKLVAAAARWTREHPFHLPPQSARALQFIGAQELLASADLTGFGTKEGGLLYVGSRDDLEEQLNGISIEEFFAQPNHEYIFEVDDDEEEFDEVASDEPPDLTDDQWEDIRKMFLKLADYSDQLADKVAQWCFTNQYQPQPGLKDAAQAFVKLLILGTMRDHQKDKGQNQDMIDGRVTRLMRGYNDEETQQRQEALIQIRGYMESQSEEGRKVILKPFLEILFARNISAEDLDLMPAASPRASLSSAAASSPADSPIGS